MRPLLLLALALFCAQASSAQNTREYQLKAVFLYNLGQFVDWPSECFTNRSSPFIIGILGNDPFGSYLEDAVRDESVSGHPIQIRHFASVGDIKSCHILFLAGSIRDGLNAVKGKPVLTVGDGADFVQEGGMIQFYTDSQKIRFLVRPSAAKSVKLNISSKLLRLARISE